MTMKCITLPSCICLRIIYFNWKGTAKEPENHLDVTNTWALSVFILFYCMSLYESSLSISTVKLRHTENHSNVWSRTKGCQRPWFWKCNPHLDKWQLHFWLHTVDYSWLFRTLANLLLSKSKFQKCGIPRRRRWVSYPVLKESTTLYKKSTPF